MLPLLALLPLLLPGAGSRSPTQRGGAERSLIVA